MPLLYRDRELAELDQIRLNLERHHLHALITGMRQVGKTALAREYQASVAARLGIPGVFIQGAHITQPAIFLRVVYEGLADALGGTSVASTSAGQVIQAVSETGVKALVSLLPLYQQTWDGTADPSACVQVAWQLPERVGVETGKPVVAVLDELQEVFHQFARVEPYRGGGGLSRVAWDARGQIQHNSRGLWVFTTSLRVVAEQFFEKSGSPFYLQTREVCLAPLAGTEALHLARDLIGAEMRVTDEALEAAAALSGGLPGILIQILSECRPGDGKPEVEEAVRRSLQTGRLAALYSDIAAGLTREGRQGSRQLLQALHAVARGHQTPKALSTRLAVSRQEASNILGTLLKLGLVERAKGSARRLSYPLMREWLLAQDAPPIGKQASDQELRAQLGFGFEARVREVLSSIRRPLVITDNAEGELLLRPGASVTLGPFVRVYRQKDDPETDVIAEQPDRTLVMGCRFRRGHVSGETIREFAERHLAAAARKYPVVWGMYLSASGFTQGAVSEAAARGIHLLTLEGLNVIARAVGEQAFTAP